MQIGHCKIKVASIDQLVTFSVEQEVVWVWDWDTEVTEPTVVSLLNQMVSVILSELPLRAL